MCDQVINFVIEDLRLFLAIWRREYALSPLCPAIVDANFVP